MNCGLRKKAALQWAIRLKFAMTLLVTAPATADQEPDDLFDEIVIYGRADEQVGTSSSASAGMVGYDDIALDFLEQAFSLGYTDQFWLRETPMLTSLHKEERFVDLLSHMNRHATEQRKLIEGDSSLTFLSEN